MSTGYQIKEQDKLYFITLQVVEWVDIFSRETYRKIITDNLEYCIKNKGLEIYAWVIMSNHVHLLAKSNTNNLSSTIRDFKSYTSKLILEQIQAINESRKDWMLKIFETAAFDKKRNTNYQFWTHDNHAEHIFSNKFMEQKLDYIHFNPVRAGIVEKPEDYIYSSAKDYAGEKGIITIEKIVVRWKTI
ncbi:MAG: transposase [Bacteroidetes bacterium]|nr:transposase [Bacteroidota bacterium]